MRRLLVSAYYGSQHVPAFRVWQEYERRQWLPPAEYEAEVAAQLESSLAKASADVPYYRSLGSGRDIAAYPRLNKRTIWQNFDDLHSQRADRAGSFMTATSGSTGRRLNTMVDRLERSARVGSTWRGECFDGLVPWANTVFLWGNTAIVKGWTQRISHPLSEWIFNRLILDCFTMNEEVVARYYPLLAARRPQRIVGYVSVLRLFAQHAAKLGFAPLRAAKIMPTAEQLDPHSEEIIRSFFQGALMQRYGCREAGDIAHVCEKGSWHLHSDFLYPEVLREDGSIGSTGTGSLLITKLRNELMPLVRYDTEDIVTLSGSRCSCGRSLPVMDELLGRLIHHLSCPDGTAVNALAVSRAVRGLPVLEYQLIQEDERQLRWLVVDAGGFSSEHARGMVDYLNRWTKNQFEISVEKVEEIPQTTGGKRMQVVNRLLLDQSSGGQA